MSHENSASLAPEARRAALGAVNEGEQEQVQRLGILEELVAERIAREAARIAEERIREIVSLEVLDPDEVLGPMEPQEAARFLDLKYATFKEIAPNLPRIFVTPANPRYLRRELLEHFRRQRGDFGPSLG